jgi:hypothetical protein
MTNRAAASTLQPLLLQFDGLLRNGSAVGARVFISKDRVLGGIRQIIIKMLRDLIVEAPQL